jgi:N-acetylmuramoyl-L-alanine amidase
MHFHKIPSTNFSERKSPIDMLVFHYTDMESTKAALSWMTNPAAEVSSHYLIDEVGEIYQLVEEEKKAWHAGESFWQGDTNLNNYSIGIELSNPGHSHGYQPFPEAQITALVTLSRDIQKRWSIPISRILGHSDIAPRRKQDPGHLFPWERLSHEGLGLWPEKVKPTPNLNVAESLAQIGYEITSLPQTILAFQRHYQPHKVDGIANEETLSLLQGLLSLQKKLIQKRQVAGGALH